MKASAQSQSHTGAGTQQYQHQHGQIVQLSAEAISTAAAVAAMSGNFHEGQGPARAPGSAPSINKGISRDNSANAACTTIKANATVMTSSSSSKPTSMPIVLPPPLTPNIRNPASSTSKTTHHHASTSQALNYQIHNTKVNPMTSTLPTSMQQHVNIQQQQQQQQQQHHPIHTHSHSHTLSQTANPMQPQGYPPFVPPQPMQPFHPYSYRRAPQQDATPQMFRNAPLRRGKWTNEEETYANAVIEAFEKGTIQGCENGCTLRAYLSRKLHCQPMRISKKFAGKSIGKQVFMSRLNSSSVSVSITSGGTSTTTAVIQTSNEKLKQLEFHFHLSVLQEGISTDPTRAMATMNSVQVNVSVNHPKAMCFGNNAHAVLQVPNRQTSSANNQPRNVSAMSTYPANNIAVSKSSLSPSMKVVVPPTAQPIPLVNMNNANKIVTPVQIPQSQIQQNLFNAFRQAQIVYASNAAENACDKGNLSSASVPTDETCRNGKKEDTNEKSSTNVDGRDIKLQSAVPKKVSERVEETTSENAKQDWINETMALIPTLDPTNFGGRYSPTYTSKSFDDLHQFIGHHVPKSPNKTNPTNDQEGGFFGPASTAANQLTLDEQHQPQIPAPRQQPIFMSPSDEYAYHAQQSAMEASKHSAYNSSPFPQPRPPRVAIKRNDTPTISMMAKFNNANLALHSKSVDNLGGQRVNSQTVYNKQGGTLVSGSERSSEMGDLGTDSSGSVIGTSSRTSSGSDNDNSSSDSASDEGRPSHNGKRKFVENHMNGPSLHSKKVVKFKSGGFQ